MRSNYSAWTIQVNDFDNLSDPKEKLNFLLGFAILAPSSHNSQPWRFEIRNWDIEIFLEQDRRLRESDKNDRQAFISLGCALENLIIAADYYGYTTSIDYGRLGSDNRTLATKVRLEPKQKSQETDPGHLIFCIPKRVTNRHPYQGKVPPEFLTRVGLSAGDNLEAFFISDQDTKNRLADVALAASVAAMEDKNFRMELSRYVHPNITSSPVGMPGFGMGIPTPASFIVPALIKHLNLNKLSRRKDEKLLKKQTPVLAVIASKDDDGIAWLKTGRIYERIALMAVAEGMSTAMWAAPVQIGEYYKDFQKILRSHLRPQAFFRLGHPTKQTPHSPRITVAEGVVPFSF